MQTTEAESDVTTKPGRPPGQVAEAVSPHVPDGTRADEIDEVVSPHVPDGARAGAIAATLLDCAGARARRTATALRERRRAATAARRRGRRRHVVRRPDAIAAAAQKAAAAAAAETPPSPPATPKRWPRTARRVLAVAGVVMIPTYVYVLVAGGGPVTKLSEADATYISEQLVHADRRVRTRLAALRSLQTATARASTRDALATTRSLAVEIRQRGGPAAERLRRVLRLEADWLDAVGSTLANPRSVLRGQLLARDRALRPALAELPVGGTYQEEGARELLAYARARSTTTLP